MHVCRLCTCVTVMYYACVQAVYVCYILVSIFLNVAVDLDHTH